MQARGGLAATSHYERKMSTFTISILARKFGLSRSTLLYYDRIGLLSPGARTSSRYRSYTEADYRKLERICNLRKAGLKLEDIRTILSSDGKPPADVLERRLREISDEILDLKAKQGLLVGMLKNVASDRGASIVDKAMWVDMLRAAGMDRDAMERWHTEFEQRAPNVHHEFLLSLGIPEEEALRIRELSRRGAETESESFQPAT
jgi:MerR family transcriptional regulator, thiopeptide resistance regulator